MTSITFMMLLACVMGLLLSIGACLVAVRLLLLSRSTSCAALSVRLSEMESTVEALSAKLKGLNSRVSMQVLRDKRREQTEPTELTGSDLEAQQQAQRDRLNSQLADRGAPR